jgi:hypothetical protein
VWVRRTAANGDCALLCLHFGREARRLEMPFRDAAWRTLVDSADVRFGGPGAGGLDEGLTVQPTSFVLLAGGHRG